MTFEDGVRDMSWVVEMFEYLAAQIVCNFFKTSVGFETAAVPSLLVLVY